jgi:hypothetical protein
MILLGGAPYDDWLVTHSANTLISQTKIIGTRISTHTWRREPRMIVVLPAQVKLGEGGQTR